MGGVLPLTFKLLALLIFFFHREYFISREKLKAIFILK